MSKIDNVIFWIVHISLISPKAIYMKNNLVVKRNSLDKIIDTLGMTAEESGMPPVSDEERGFVKLQILCAQVLAKDAMEISAQNPKHNLRNALSTACNNLVANISSIATEILRNPKMQMDIAKKLKKINKMRM